MIERERAGREREREKETEGGREGGRVGGREREHNSKTVAILGRVRVDG